MVDPSQKNKDSVGVPVSGILPTIIESGKRVRTKNKKMAPTPSLPQKKGKDDDSSKETKCAIRSWFQSLSPNDKAISLSLTDKKFIGMFLQLVEAFPSSHGELVPRYVSPLSGRRAILAARENVTL